MGEKINERTLILVLGIGLLMIPSFASGYILFQFTMAFIITIAILGLVVLTGYSGQISLGHGAFYAIGGYITAILNVTYGVFPIVAVGVAVIICFGIGFLIGYPALRIKGPHLALVTFALAVAIPQLLKWDPIAVYTYGRKGIVLDPVQIPSMLSYLGTWITVDRWLYMTCLAAMISIMFICNNLSGSRVGRALRALRDNELGAVAMGIDVSRFKIIVFGVSAAITGFAGALLALTVSFVSPDSFGFFISLNFFVAAVLGGLTSVIGAFLGGLFLQFIPELSSDISQSAPAAIYGLLLIVSIYLFPNGLAGMFRKWAKT